MFKIGIIVLGIIAALILIIGGASKLPINEIARDTISKEKPLETVKELDFEKYQGQWYSVYEFPAWFQEGCTCTQAEYSLRTDGKIKVKNSCKIGEGWKVAEAVAWPIKEDDNSKLYVKFRSPFKGKYFVIDITDDYQEAMVGTPDRNYLWILSREKTIDDMTLKRFKEKAEELGFDTNRLEKVNQECSKPKGG